MKHQGQPVNIRGKIVEDAVVKTQLRIQLGTTEATVKHKTLAMVVGTHRLAATANEQGTVTGQGTYFWTYHPAMSNCPMVAVRNITAKVTMGQVNTIIDSIDDSCIRFTRKRTESQYNRIVYHTDHPDLFLLDLGAEEPIEHPLHQDDARITTFITMRDDFVYNTVVENIQKEIEELLQETCT